MLQSVVRASSERLRSELPFDMFARVDVDAVSAAIGVSVPDVRAAAARLDGVAHVTPVLTSVQMDSELSARPDTAAATRFFFKVEAFQKTGSFKFRGAYNAVAALSDKPSNYTASTPVITHSSGNHGQAVALAAALLGRPAYVVVPRGAPAVKVAAVQSYGAEVVRCGPTLAERTTAAEKLAMRVDGVLVHPFMNTHVVAGQGTIALELLEQVQDLDAIIVPIGGGGMVAGIAIVAQTLHPAIRVFGAQPENANVAARSLAEGRHLTVTVAPDTVADGLKAGLGSIGWAVVSNLVEDVLTVSEEEVMDATRLVWQRMKVVIEPSAGVGVAVARSERFRNLGLKRVAIILCGGNVDVSAFLPNRESVR
jgi:threonine dehydratase